MRGPIEAAPPGPGGASLLGGPAQIAAPFCGCPPALAEAML